MLLTSYRNSQMHPANPVASHNRPLWHLWRLMLVLTVVFGAPPLAQAQPSIEIRSQDSLLSIQTTTATASELAEALTEELGISVIVTGDTESILNVDIVDEPLERALTQLSSNYMLVRNGKSKDSKIIEVILIMGDDGGGDSSAGNEQFLPSGSSVEDVVSNQQQAETLAGDGSQQTEETQSDAPAQEAFDPQTGLPIDPTTGLPIDPATGLPIDPATGLPVQ